MAWNRTRLEVPAITGDPSVLLAAPPRTADGFHGLTEQLRYPSVITDSGTTLLEGDQLGGPLAARPDINIIQ